jgi:hypothetical protein
MASDEGDQAERQFWTTLEFRVCDEMRRLPVPRKLGLWCDGFIPENYIFDRMPNYITGVVWIGTGPRGQEKWKFVLMLPSSLSSPSDIAWSELLPAPEASGWLIVATEKKELEIELGH